MDHKANRQGKQTYLYTCMCVCMCMCVITPSFWCRCAIHETNPKQRYCKRLERNNQEYATDTCTHTRTCTYTYVSEVEVKLAPALQ